MSDNGSTVTKSRGAKGSIILILWHYTWNEDTDYIGVGRRVFYIQYYYFWERYFSDLSGSEGGDYLDTSSSSRGSVVVVVVVGLYRGRSSSCSRRFIPR